MQTLEDFLEGNEYFVGNHVTLADMAFLGSVSTLIVSFTEKFTKYILCLNSNFLKHFGYNISNFKNVSAWYERCRSLPGKNLINVSWIKFINKF